ncbi:polysaccharide deacetylase [Paenibacillus sp. ACRRX]|uniref:polysaccharide deacetylase family protein n=1 Tax=Paenibacillus sp. ACRRX TaxID=2918206 RepID=UPI001EF5A65F|nr:polysaccharide deacetylase family protein [Paenibacillus sp. ACRRX]MCG7408426.1 polysaccharide deacetylase [Paenibacillus sp. ACRRX]
MREKKRRMETRLLAILGIIALLIGGEIILGVRTAGEEIAYAAAQQQWRAHPVSAATQTPYRKANTAHFILKDGAAHIPKIERSLPTIEHEAKAAGAASALLTVGKQSKKVYLTFDDGPSRNTPEVLDILKRENVKGTFYLLGQQVKQYPKVLKRIADEGHAIGNHSYNHNYRELYSDFRGFWSQIRKTGKAIQEVIGYEPPLVRAPGGTFLNFNKQYFDLMGRAGYVVMDWTVDSGDSKRVGVPAKEIVADVKKGTLSADTVVLMHDGTGHGETVKALPEIIRYYKAKGYSFEVMTPEMKQVQFRIADRERWDRKPVSQAWIQANIDLVQVATGEPVKQPQPPTGGTTPKPPIQKSDPLLMQLKVTTDSGELELASNQFRSYQDITYVPVRLMIEKLGGTVTFDEAKELLLLNINGLEWAIDWKTGKPMQLEIDGTLTVLPWETQMKDNLLWVPLRQALEVSHVQFLSYELQVVDPNKSSSQTDENAKAEETKAEVTK